MPRLTADQLLRAYAMGVFPMARTRDDTDLFWVDPDMRGILPLDGVHLPRSLKKTIRQKRFAVTADQAFAQVIEGCAATTGIRTETWINDEIMRLFIELHGRGIAHSVEVWADGALAGGLYGLSLGAAFFGESMFSRTTDASKVALVHLVAGLKSGGYTLLDTQFVTEHLTRFGAIEIPRRTYLRRLGAALNGEARFPGGFDATDVLEPFIPSHDRL